MDDIYKAIMKGKKRPDQLEDAEKNAMMSELKNIHKMASDDMGHDIHGLKKVSVASNTENGLKAGLDQAKGMVQDHAKGTFDNEDAERVSKSMRNPSHSQLDRSKMKDEVSDEEPEMNDKHDGMPSAGHEDDDEDMGHGASNGRYADGGMVHGDATDVEHQSMQSHGFQTKDAPGVIAKEKNTDEMQKFGAPGREMGTHGTHADPDDEYADLDHEDVEALIAHLMKRRK
jgi:hypothetical protein